MITFCKQNYSILLLYWAEFMPETFCDLYGIRLLEGAECVPG